MDELDKLIRKLKMTLDEAYGYGVTLWEMSDPLYKVKSHIAELSEQIFVHCMKLIMYGKEEKSTVHHWCHELNNWLNQCIKRKIKRKGKDTYPTSQELYDWLHYHYKDGTDILGIRRVLEHEYIYQGHKKRDISDQDLYEQIDKLLFELCPMITQNCSDEDIENIVVKYFI